MTNRSHSGTAGSAGLNGAIVVALLGLAAIIVFAPRGREEPAPASTAEVETREGTSVPVKVSDPDRWPLLREPRAPSAWGSPDAADQNRFADDKDEAVEVL